MRAVLSMVSKNSFKGAALSVPPHFGTSATSDKSLVAGVSTGAAPEGSALLTAAFPFVVLLSLAFSYYSLRYFN